MTSVTTVSEASVRDLLGDYLATEAAVTVLEEGVPVFDLTESKYSVSESHGKCLLHVWSESRNIVRRVIDAERRRSGVVLTVQKFGKTQPVELEFCATGDRRSASGKKAARSQYAKLLQRLIGSQKPGWRIEALSTGMDLERSFSPIYTRALVRHGNSALAVLGVNATEMQASVDAALGFGILWLDACRRSRREFLVEGLRLYVPPG